MRKETIYIVLSHKHSLNRVKQWEVAEKVEFVNRLKNSHISSAVAICNYTEQKMFKGESNNMGVYSEFIDYVTKKYPEQMDALAKAYGEEVIEEDTGCGVEAAIAA